MKMSIRLQRNHLEKPVHKPLEIYSQTRDLVNSAVNVRYRVNDPVFKNDGDWLLPLHSRHPHTLVLIADYGRFVTVIN